MRIFKYAVIVVAAFTLSACGSESDLDAARESPLAFAQEAEIERLNAFFEEVFQRDLSRSPIFQTYIGVKDDYDKLDDLSEERADEDLALARQDLDRLYDEFDVELLDDPSMHSYRIFELQRQLAIEGDRWRHHNYPVNQLFGWQSTLPAFLITAHAVTSVSDAEAYVARLGEVERFIGQIVDGLVIRADKGVIPPRFVFPMVIENSRTIITGAPFDGGDDSTLLADFIGKVGGLELDSNEEERLIEAARDALLNSVQPGYQRLITALEDLEAIATEDDGVWKLPDGGEYYTFRLREMTTTDMTADEIHDLGLVEVGRIQDEMHEILRQVGFDGTLQDFFQEIREDPRFIYPQTDEGKEQYLADARSYIEGMEARLDEAFATRPQAALEVRAVEPFREQGAAAAFYQPPALDGSRPAYYYVNTYDMAQMPKYQLEALTYHEAVPGHHMQIAIAQELDHLPTFRKFARFTAFIEGWALYAERLPKEMGFYEDPYSDFGRLALEIWRAARLVVDTGIHSKRWTREQAIDYLGQNTPNPHGDNVREVERYIVMPGQATAYKIGMEKILELREQSREILGDRFDLRGFHDVVLKNGAVPLFLLEEIVGRWTGEVAAGVIDGAEPVDPTPR